MKPLSFISLDVRDAKIIHTFDFPEYIKDWQLLFLDIFEALTENYVEIIQDPEKGKLFSCKLCGKLVKNRTNLQHHVESSHIPPQQERYTCTYCGIKKFTYKALEKHHYKDHRDYVLSKNSYIAQ